MGQPLKGLPLAKPGFVPPMKALARAKLPEDGGWQFELKLDGIRAIAVKDGAAVELYSRLPRRITGDFSEIAQAISRLPVAQATLDGEIVALDEKGHPSFQLLQNLRRAGARRPPVYYCIFDLVNLDGRDLKGVPLNRRRQLLATLLRQTSDPLRPSPALEGPPEVIWATIKEMGLEGLIAKRSDSIYEPDRRSGAWLKIKTSQEQEFVIGGYTAPQGTRKYFGALLVGYYGGKSLKFAGKVGTGFNTAMLESLHRRFQALRTPGCPFSNLPGRRHQEGDPGLTPSEMRKCVWLKPKLICQVRFQEWTQDGILRQPAFRGLRDDKKPSEVLRE